MIAILAAAVAAAAGAAPAAGDQPASLAELHAVYQQSCEVRAYLSYDDLCDGLRKRIREAEKADRKAAKSHPAPASKADSTAQAAPIASRR